MWLVCFCAGITILQSAWTDSFSSLAVALAVLAAAMLTELLFCYPSRDFSKLKDGSAAASALVFALLLPNHINPVYAALGAVFAMAVVKHSFGGLGSNWLNPALGGWLFTRFSWPDAFMQPLEASPLTILSDSISKGFSNPQGSPLGLLKIGGAGNNPWAGSRLDASVSSFLNGTVFSFTGSELPVGYVDLFTARAPGIIADRGLFALLLGSAVLIAFQAGRAWIPAAYLGFYALLIRIFGALPYGGGMGNGDIIFGLLSGGTIPAAFLLVLDPATGAKSNCGMLAASILAALCTFVFRYQGGEAYGAFFAVALVNALVPLIRTIEFRLLYSTGRGTAA
jgi:electron transport complex protein RnfD